MGNCLCPSSTLPSSTPSTLPPSTLPLSTPPTLPLSTLPSVPSIPLPPLPLLPDPPAPIAEPVLIAEPVPIADPLAPIADPAPIVEPDLREIYKRATYENTPEFTFEGLRTLVKILRIVDGDTVDIALRHESSARIYRHRVRLYGIDTPEKRPSKSDPNRHLEIEASFRAKDALERRVQENDFIVLGVFHHADKYGRLLCTFYDKDGHEINQWMVAHGFATEYFGKTKKAFQVVSADSILP